MEDPIELKNFGDSARLRLMKSPSKNPDLVQLLLKNSRRKAFTAYGYFYVKDLQDALKEFS